MVVYPAGNAIEVIPGSLIMKYSKDGTYEISHSTSASVKTNTFCEVLDTRSAQIYTEESSNGEICKFVSLEYRQLDSVRLFYFV